MQLQLPIRVTNLFVATAAALVTVLFGCSQLFAAKYAMPRTARAGQLSEVSLTFEASGWLSVPGKPLPRRLKMSVKSEQKYQQRLMKVAVDQATDASDHLGARLRCQAVRRYDSIETQMLVAKHEMKPVLRDERRLVSVVVGDGAATIFSPNGPLTRDELDLIQQPGDSLIADLLLPTDEVEIGDKWQHDDATMALLLGLEEVGDSNVTSELKTVADRKATVELAGTVHGAIHGVASQIELKGRYHYDLRNNRLTYLQLVIQEKRGIGHVTPGVEVVAKLKMQVTPRFNSPELNDAALAGLALVPGAAQTRLSYDSGPSRFRFLYDRDWHVTMDQRQRAVLRRMQHGELIAQCNLSLVADSKRDKKVGLEQFQADIRQALGKHHGKFIRSEKFSDEKGRLVYRVEAQGKVNGLAVRWLYYMLTHTDGRRLAAVFTMDSGLVDKFAGADRPILDSFELRAVPASDKAASAETSAKEKTEQATVEQVEKDDRDEPTKNDRSAQRNKLRSGS